MADISQVELSSGEVCDIKDAAARSAIIAIQNMLGDLYPVLVDATAIPSNADLDSYTTPGTFYATTEVAATLSNANITTVGFKMLVIKCTKNDLYLWQIKIAVHTNCIIALRFYNGSSWGAWKRLTPA